MKGELVCINGKTVRWGETGLDPNTLLAANFLYQKVHTLERRVLQVVWHAEIFGMSSRALYGCDPGIDAAILQREAAAVLDANRYPASGNLVAVYLIPDENGGFVRLLACERTMLYKGYAFWHTGLDCVVTPYEYPFPQHKTAISLAAHTLAESYARRKGFSGAIAENNTGVLTGLGDNPLFAVVRDTVFTTALADGAADSVERRLGIEACSEAGLTVTDQPVRSENIRDFDEIFTVTPQGIVSVRTCEGKLFPHSKAKNIAEKLRTFAGK